MNVVVICLDTMRTDMVHTFGADSIRTPVLDNLAAESVVFTEAYGCAYPTIPVRRALFTGMDSFPWRFGYDTLGSSPSPRGWHKIPPEHTPVAERLVEAGINTGFIADTYHMFKATMNFTRGFCSWDFVRGQEFDHWKTLPPGAVDPTQYTDASPDSPRMTGMLQYLWNQGERTKDDDFQAARVFLSAMDWVENNAAYGPFYLYIDSFDPHEPWDPPLHYADAYFRDDSVKDYIWPVGTEVEGDAAIKRTKALYYGEVTFVDTWIGHFLDKLEALHLLEDTVIIFTSDHGTELLDRNRFGKSEDHLQWFNTRINMFIRHPDKQHAGKRLDAFVQHQDVPPTVLDLFGVAYQGLDGTSMWPLVTGEREKNRDFIVAGWGQHATVRDHEYNYVIDFEQGPRKTDSGGFTVTQETSAQHIQEELYNLGDDPLETLNVLESEPEAALKQRARLEGFLGQELPARLDDRVDTYEYPRRVHARTNPNMSNIVST